MTTQAGRFEATDENAMRAIAARLRPHGLMVEYDPSFDLDCFWIGVDGSPAPAWVIHRDASGRYQLRDGLLGIEREGDSLLEILPPDWLPSADCGGDVAGFGAGALAGSASFR